MQTYAVTLERGHSTYIRTVRAEDRDKAVSKAREIVARTIGQEKADQLDVEQVVRVDI